MQFQYPHTETLAEHAWRYGTGAQREKLIQGWLFNLLLYPDYSALLFADDMPMCVVQDWQEILPKQSTGDLLDA